MGNVFSFELTTRIIHHDDMAEEIAYNEHNEEEELSTMMENNEQLKNVEENEMNQNPLPMNVETDTIENKDQETNEEQQQPKDEDIEDFEKISNNTKDTDEPATASGSNTGNCNYELFDEHKQEWVSMTDEIQLNDIFNSNELLIKQVNMNICSIIRKLAIAKHAIQNWDEKTPEEANETLDCILKLISHPQDTDSIEHMFPEKSPHATPTSEKKTQTGELTSSSSSSQEQISPIAVEDNLPQHETSEPLLDDQSEKCLNAENQVPTSIKIENVIPESLQESSKITTEIIEQIQMPPKPETEINEKNQVPISIKTENDIHQDETLQMTSATTTEIIKQSEENDI